VLASVIARDGVRSVVTGGVGSVVPGGGRSVVTGGVGSVVTGGVRSVVAGGVGSVVTGGVGSVVAGGVRSVVTGGVAGGAADDAVYGRAGALLEPFACALGAAGMQVTERRAATAADIADLGSSWARRLGIPARRAACVLSATREGGNFPSLATVYH
jgi:hypothetical protein